MKNYRNSKSDSAQWAAWTVTKPDGSMLSGYTLLSSTHAKRALRRLIAHWRKQVPEAIRIEAEFEALALSEDELTSWMDSAQLIAWRTARATKGDTFLRLGAPACGCDGLFSPSYCTECEKWHEGWRGTCFDVCEGVPYVFDWYCDADGDWYYDPRCPLSQWTERLQQEDWDAACAVADEYEQAMQESK